MNLAQIEKFPRLTSPPYKNLESIAQPPKT